MSPVEHQWEKSGFVSAKRLLHKEHVSNLKTRRLSSVLRGKQVKMASKPVMVGGHQESLQIIPVVKEGKITALRVVCACGNESTFDIQYAPGGGASV